MTIRTRKWCVDPVVGIVATTWENSVARAAISAMNGFANELLHSYLGECSTIS